MKAKILSILLAVFVGINATFLLSCSKEGDNKDGSTDIKRELVSKIWEKDGINYYFYSNQSVFMEITVNPSPGDLVLYNSRAIGNWALINNEISIYWTAFSLGLKLVDINAPTKLYLIEDPIIPYLKEADSGDLINPKKNKTKIDYTSNDLVDKGILGKWSKEFSVQDSSTGMSNNVDVNMEFFSDGNVRTTEPIVSQMDYIDKFSTQKGVLKINKFLGDSPVTFFYSIEDGNRLFLYDYESTEISMVWTKIEE